MKQAERILSIFPHFYLAWDKRALMSRLVHSMAMVLNQQQSYFFRVQKAHWVDTAYGSDLDELGKIFNLKRGAEELDDSFRERIKYALVNFKGGGTREAVMTQIMHYFRLRDDEFELVENPEKPQSQEVIVGNGSGWKMRNRSIRAEEEAEIVMQLEPTGLGGVANPRISNSSRPDESIQYQGMLNPGETLIIRQGKAELDGKDVTKKVIPKKPISIKIPRRTADWKYEESTSPKIGFFDSAKFDDGFVFYRDVPTIRITFKWRALMAATFRVKVRQQALDRGGFKKTDVIKLVNAIKAAGVEADVE
jgi:hypothetical protein